MTATEEENFPRGRRKATKTLKRPPSNDNLFPTKSQSKTKKRRKQTAKKPSVSDDLEVIRVNDTLSYQKLREDSVVLGCVRHITNFSLEIELPGLLFGQVAITNVSSQFTEVLNDRLKASDDCDSLLGAMFEVGQFVVVKVLRVERKENGWKIDCSMNPSDVNKGRSMNSFGRNMLVWACVESALDHGYQLSVGVKNCRVFLPRENVDEGKKYVVGEPLWCIVHKHTENKIASTLRVGARRDQIDGKTVEEIANLNDLMPGSCVDFVTDKILPNGIQGRFLDDFHGYVHENFLADPLDETADHDEGKLLKAHVLYVEPTTKIAHLSLRAPGSNPAAFAHRKGDVVQGLILSKTSKGLYLKLPGDEKALVTNNRLLKCLTKNDENDLREALAAKFPPGGRQDCLILDRSYLSRLHVATLEPALVKQRGAKVEDVTPGQLVRVRVERVKPEGLVVAGRCGLRGFVPNFHVCNAEFSEAVKRKFVADLEVRARVLKVDADGSALMTLKQGMVECDDCLRGIEEAEAGKKYPGIVVSANSERALVVFYGDLKGNIHRNSLDAMVAPATAATAAPSTTATTAPSTASPMNSYFFRGQVVKVGVLGVKNGYLQLSLKEGTRANVRELHQNPRQNPHQNPRQDLNQDPNRDPCEGNTADPPPVGKIISGIVDKVHEDTLDVRIFNGAILGTVPTHHLTPCGSLGKPLLGTYRVGDRIGDLMCVDNASRPIVLSRREGIRSKGKATKEFKQLNQGNVVRCLYESQDPKLGVTVTIPCKDFHDKVTIATGNFHLRPLPEFEPHQAMLATILSIDKGKRTVKLSTRTVQPSVEYALNLFSQQLSDLQRVRKLGKLNGWPHCQYQPGQRVNCTVKKVTTIGCAVTLPNGCIGLVPKPLCQNVKNGEQIEGVVLSQDMASGHVELCLDKKVSSCISAEQNGVTEISHKSSCQVEKLLETKNYILAVLKQPEGKGQLVYIPLALNENGFDGNQGHYRKNKFKISLCGKIKKCLFGMSTKLFVKLEENKKKTGLDILKRKKNKQKMEDNLKVGSSDDDSCCSQHSDSDDSDSDSNSDSDDEYEEMIGRASKKRKLTKREKESDCEENEDEDENEEEEEEEEVEDEIEDKEEDGEDEEEDEDKEEEEVESVEEENSDDEPKSADDAENEEVENEEGENNIETKDDDATDEEKTNDKPKGNENKRSALMPGIGSFFASPSTRPSHDAPSPSSSSSSSSDDDCSDSDNSPGKSTTNTKKKLSRAERTDRLREEEERISKIEKRLADGIGAPESADDFDRLLAANPDSAMLWTRYMAHHVSSTEIDKARTVAKKALETIATTEIQERLNVWLALLHLENAYGSGETFENAFREAVRCNDSLEIYLPAIRMLAESSKLTEMGEKIKKIKNKFKQQPKMWTELGQVYYKLGWFKEARNAKDAALKSILDKKTQMQLIVRFALMEFKDGEAEHGAAIFESIVNADPRKINVWSTYVDQLVKIGQIEQARKVLERSVCQKLPAKSMKSLFLKFRKFEEAHGNVKFVEAVKVRAMDYMLKANK